MSIGEEFIRRRRPDKKVPKTLGIVIRQRQLSPPLELLQCSLGRMSTVPRAPVPAVSKTDVAAGSQSSTAADSVPVPAASVTPQEYSVRVPKSSTKPMSIMRFNKALGVDPSKWNSLKMVREGHLKHHKPAHPEEDQPKFGAGSEYGREVREEAKRRKYGDKKVNLEDQPWILKTSENKSRKYRGVKEDMSGNASYYIFTQAADGAFEVFPVNHWYNFTPIQRYKSLTSEEAEEQFGRRNKIHNYFSVMVRKRFKADEDHGDEEVERANVKKTKYSSGLKVSEMDEWGMDSDDDSDKDNGEKKPRKKKGDCGEAEEDSDDGDEDGREVEYMSDSSESESEEEAAKKNAVVGVDQEDALKKLLDSDSEEEEKPEEAESGAVNDPNSKKSEGKDSKDNTNRDLKHENLSDDDDEDVDEQMDGLETAKLESGSSGTNSGSTRDVDGGTKRKATSGLISGITNASNNVVELSPLLVQAAASEGITKEAVRRYLLRKPMTVTELLKKFKPKKKNITSQDMVIVIAHILKKIGPVKKMQNQKMYLYLTQT